MALPALTLPFSPDRIAASPDGDWLLLIDDGGAIWRAPVASPSDADDTGFRIPTAENRHRFAHIQGSQDFSRIAVSGAGPLQALDLVAKAPLSLPSDRTHAAISPDGRWRLVVSASRITYTDGDHTAGFSTRLALPRHYLLTDPPTEESPARTLDCLDHADTPITRPLEEGVFELVVACYGYAISLVLREGAGVLTLAPREARVVGGLVYDPSDLIDTSHLALVRHGYGCSVAALSADREQAWDFKPQELMAPGYGVVSGAIADRDGPRALVLTRHGRYLWTPHTGERRRVFFEGHPVLLRGERLLVRDGLALSWAHVNH